VPVLAKRQDEGGPAVDPRDRPFGGHHLDGTWAGFGRYA
jgi:hypothetical protein